MSSILRIILIVLFFSSLLPAQDETGGALDSLSRETASGKYIDPASFFRFHGYVTLTYAEPQKDLSGQILVSDINPQNGRNEGGFKNDAALFVGGEPIDGLGTVIELHFVGNALDPVITEAKMILDLARFGQKGNLKLTAGRFWWPFGIHNDEWFSAVNRFNLVSPAAMQVVPAHLNEVGAALEGVYLFQPHFGANYVLSVGNGVSSFEMPDIVKGPSNAFDYNHDRTLTGRIGLVWNANGRMELGLSYARGLLRNAPLVSDPADPRYYKADFNASGLDIRILKNGFGLRGYYYLSNENLTAAPRSVLKRHGGTVEPFYRFNPGMKIKYLEIHARYSYAAEDGFWGQRRWAQGGLGLHVRFQNKLLFKTGYMRQDEGGILQHLANDVLTISLTAEF